MSYYAMSDLEPFIPIHTSSKYAWHISFMQGYISFIFIFNHIHIISCYIWFITIHSMHTSFIYAWHASFIYVTRCMRTRPVRDTDTTHTPYTHVHAHQHKRTRTHAHKRCIFTENVSFSHGREHDTHVEWVPTHFERIHTNFKPIHTKIHSYMDEASTRHGHRGFAHVWPRAPHIIARKLVYQLRTYVPRSPEARERVVLNVCVCACVCVCVSCGG